LPFRVAISQFVADKAAERFGNDRSEVGAPSEYDFFGGPLAAAGLAFSDFTNLRAAAGGRVRAVTIVDPVFGPTVFIGVRLRDDTIEIADFEADSDYWDLVDDDLEG
jgi:hypothetical protein